MATTDPPPPRLTEAKVTELLRQRHSAPGNGGAGEHAFLAQVRNAAGFDANRTFDAVTVGLWPSRGLPVDVWEIKVSRSDWLNELRKPAKAEDACLTAEVEAAAAAYTAERNAARAARRAARAGETEVLP